MTITAKIIEDSISEAGVRLTTFQLRYPRYIHAELMTHRVFSRNASSSRAIPVNKLVNAALEDIVFPARWGINQAGMQARDEELSSTDQAKAMVIWAQMAKVCAEGVQQLAELGLHKQWANRPLEWFSHINVVLTATDWDNWFALRDHPKAMPEIADLARAMRRERGNSLPWQRRLDKINASSWHLPYVSRDERSMFADEPTLLAKMSSARCARASYNNHDGTVPVIEKDLALFTDLFEAKPAHASPFEHQAYPLYDGQSRSRNFRGWRQFRDYLGV